MAEPSLCIGSRYFAEASATLACQVYGTRERSVGCTKPGFDYWITDGLYGSMNCVLYDHAVLSARVLNKPTDLVRNPDNSGARDILILIWFFYKFKLGFWLVLWGTVDQP